MSSYLVYICQAVKDRAGQERYWEVAPAVYPKNIDVLAGWPPGRSGDQEPTVAARKSLTKFSNSSGAVSETAQ
jgi:hypothetical protein